MGVSTSSPQASTEGKEIKDLEASVASTGNLPMLRRAFENLQAESAKTSVSASVLQGYLHCKFLKLENKESMASAELTKLLSELGPSVVADFFMPEDGQVSWELFLRGYDKCCGRPSASVSVNLLFRVFHEVKKRAQAPSNLRFTNMENDSKVDGHFSEDDVCVFLWICWVMLHNARLQDLFDKNYTHNMVDIPEVAHLVKSAVVACSRSVAGELNIKNSNDTSNPNSEIPVQNLFSWILATIPGLSLCFAQYVRDSLQRASVSLEVACQPAQQTDDPLRSSNVEMADMGLLTSGIAWAIGLSLRDSLGEELMKASFMFGSHLSSCLNLIYRSSLHGKGLNRLWSNVEGYHGPSLILISGSSTQDGVDVHLTRRWVMGALIHRGFENKDSFYGSSGCLYAVSPIFQPFFPTGREKNFVYSHLHAPGRVYEAHPKTVGIAFGGTCGNERVFLDEDFAKITIRHHVVDKTYQPGSLLPGQEYLPVEASIFEVEVWGLGGKSAELEQARFKKREQIFVEQRRKVDLKNFANWEESPEKIMMDLISNPNRVQREKR